ncbi:MAG: hypothetical protein WBV69_11815 [Candidatus Sulfotelmatobacter sp.]
MPKVKLSVELSYQQGQKAAYSVETPGVCPTPPQEIAALPYQLTDATGPEQPTLVSSTSFVQIG